ncbi:MAG: metal-dependent transcriptional regulator [Bacteroidota bacterium]
MESVSITEENYLKAIFKIGEREGQAVSNKAISLAMETSPASVTSMLNHLGKNGYVNYQSRKGVTLTPKGKTIATALVRKHRLWEVFLMEKLHFSWDEVHHIAEELEHISSEELVTRLDHFLGYPKFDPHGDPIPDADGNMTQREQILLSEVSIGEAATVTGVDEHSSAFLQYLDQLGLSLGTKLTVIEQFAFDESIKVAFDSGEQQILTAKVSQNLFVKVTFKK